MKQAETDSIAIHQLKHFFPLSAAEAELIRNGEKHFAQTLKCLSASTNKYYARCLTEGINPYHSNSYCIYLYWLAREVHELGHDELADKIYYLNKIMNAADLFYEVELPAIWGCDHPLGSVMGRGRYGEYFLFTQGCTIGNNLGHYPVLGHHVAMLSNSKIIGDCHIGNYCVIAANAYLKDLSVPDCSMVFGQFPHTVVKPLKKEYFSYWKESQG